MLQWYFEIRVLAYLVLPLGDKMVVQWPGEHRLVLGRAFVQGPGHKPASEILWELGHTVAPRLGPWVQQQLGPRKAFVLNLKLGWYQALIPETEQNLEGFVCLAAAVQAG